MISVTGTSQNEVSLKTSSHLVAGGVAGMISSLILQPFDLLKTRLQQQRMFNDHYKPTISKELKKLTTYRDLWRGTLPSTLRMSIGSGLYFTTLSTARTYISKLKNRNERSQTSVLPKLSPIENLTTGFIVRVIVGFMTMPITIMKTRFESNVYNYSSLYEGVESIYFNGNEKKMGSIRNFFKGSVATLARDGPYAGLHVLFYESFKNNILPYAIMPLHQTLIPNSTLVNSTSAALAAACATTITAPFDAIKTRLQLTSGNKTASNIRGTTRQLLKEDGGFRNLFRGLSLRLSRKGMSAAIIWCTYEELLKGPFSQMVAIQKT